VREVGEVYPRSSGAVEVAPEALGPARAGSGSESSVGLAQRWREHEVTPAAERSRPLHAQGVGGLPWGQGRAESFRRTCWDGAGDAEFGIHPLLGRGQTTMEVL
jgi:hypothetical protein